MLRMASVVRTSDLVRSGDGFDLIQRNIFQTQRPKAFDLDAGLFPGLPAKSCREQREFERVLRISRSVRTACGGLFNLGPQTGVPNLFKYETNPEAIRCGVRDWLVERVETHGNSCPRIEIDHVINPGGDIRRTLRQIPASLRQRSRLNIDNHIGRSVDFRCRFPRDNMAAGSFP